ncbi:MAG: cytochrome c oxidase assembly protein [Candidatus Eremiobacteraeota bacterium]|nr:cytochrome c oxidase assembly protein [Candidatus Eremiobacteraeota bacterium]
MKHIPRRAACAIAACVVACAVFCAPFVALTDVSFAWHMVQHLAVLFVLPLLLLLAEPFSWFGAVAGKRLTAIAVRAGKRLTIFASPPVALAAFIAVLWWSHFSGLYEGALDHLWIHAIEHSLFFAAGIIFWLPVLAPAPMRALAFPARLLYLLIALPQGALLSAAIASAHAPLYAHYAYGTTTAAAMADQNAAASVMWIGGGAIVLAAFLGTLGVWAKRERSHAISSGAPCAS